MGQEDIEAMIAHALETAEEGRGRGRARPRLVHERHIVDQYVALCGDVQAPDPEARIEVAVPVARAGGAAARGHAGRLWSALKRLLAAPRR